VCAAYLRPLLARLEATFPHDDPHLRQTAVHEALLDYVQHPQRYDPAQTDLGAYLRMAARRDLLNLRQREARHRRRREPWSVVEDEDNGGNLSGREEEPPAALLRREEAEGREALFQAVAEGCSPQEKRVLDLMRAGERRTSAYADAVDAGGQPSEEQERVVKRVKDRLKKRIERGGPGDE
jgi:RNA polymerase sigma-70 factor (ECF subfamily)